MKKDIKDVLMIVSALVTLASGITMAFLSFFLSDPHNIHDSVLWYFAQCLIYTASAFGIVAYVRAKVDGINAMIHGPKT